MDTQEAEAARGSRWPVIDTHTNELGIVENVKADGKVMVLYLGERLARITQAGDLAAVDNLLADNGGLVYRVHVKRGDDA